MNRLDGRVAAITGGNSGIGRATALAFRRQGARVAILGRNRETLEETGDRLGEGALVHQGDVTRIEDLERFYRAVRERLGRLDVLVASAGLAEVRPLEEADEEHFDGLVDVNFRGAFFTLQRALPHLRTARR